MADNAETSQPDEIDQVSNRQRLAAHFDQLAVSASSHTDQLRKQDGAAWLAAHALGKQDAYREAASLTRLMIRTNHLPTA